MYTIVDNSYVIRDLDGKQVAPCYDATDFDYLSYVLWIEEGNVPNEVSTTPPEV